MQQTKKTLESFPEFVKINSTLEALRREDQEIAQRMEKISVELSKATQTIDGQDAWSLALEGKGFRMEIDAASSLREEFQMLEGRRRFVTEALAVGVMALDAARGKYSLELCQQIRPQWTAEIKAILESLKRICEANASLDRMRADIEAQGVRTDSFPYSKFDLGGSWNDPYGGKIVGFQRDSADHFPELVTRPAWGSKPNWQRSPREKRNLGKEHNWNEKCRGTPETL
jgi:hypothetical protein